MLAAAPARHVPRLLPVVLAAFLYGCSDAPTPLEPRAPARPNALLTPNIVVTNTDDAGPGSLRQAIFDATDGGIIVFDPSLAGKTIELFTGALIVGKTITIEGPINGGITISGSLLSQVIWVKNIGDLVLRNASVINGRDKFAGAILVEGAVVLDHSLVANSETAEGDGGAILVRDDAMLTVVNSTISGNVTPFRGGAIYSLGWLTIRNSTITSNYAVEGGGLWIGDTGKLNVRNSIIAFNSASGAPVSPKPNCRLSSLALLTFTGVNIVNDDSCGSDPAILEATPLLAPLANNGGPTKTHALKFGPGVDAGTLCSETTDQRYVSRNLGTSCDVGAFEFAEYGSVTLTIDPNASVSKSGVATVTGKINCSSTAAVRLDVRLAQLQKKGKSVDAQTLTALVPCGTTASSWSVSLTSTDGVFDRGAATAQAATALVPPQFTGSNVTAPVTVAKGW